ncbi:glycosyltransferase [Rubrolithibacter danxiaensis]|uniref:glycosyltransferase n=1 Tax=Rubrolithibacter danxiaensis TaxID=3390805 RepID=UPI003BF851C7
MTLIHLLIGLGGGGAESFLLEISKKIKENPGVEILVVTITTIDTIAYKYEAEGIKYISLGMNNSKGFLKKFKIFLNILKSYDQCVVHAHMFHACMLAALAKFFRPKVRIVFTLHTNFVKQKYRRILLFLTRKLRSEDIIFSADSKQWYHKENSKVIANGIDTSKFNLINKHSEIFTFLFLGRLAEPKNPLFLIDLSNKLKDRFKFKILVAGDGSLRQELEERIAKYKLQEYFSLLGFRDDIPCLFSQAHCLIMPSLWEGMPMAVLEAGAAGIPVISTPVGSIPTILNDKNAYLSNLEDFHLQMEEVILSYETAIRKGNLLQDLIKKEYDISSSARKHLKLYNKVLGIKSLVLSTT